MRAHGVDRQVEALGDLGVGGPLGHEADDMALPLGEPGDHRGA
jgi:hypothetical protein